MLQFAAMQGTLEETRYPIGRILAGDEQVIRRSYDKLHAQPVDKVDICNGPTGYFSRRTTLARSASVTGMGTFSRRAQSTLTFQPSRYPGWWIERTDQREQLPIEVSVRNIWTTQRNIVLRSGSTHNYLRMVEHIIALRLGLGIDDLTLATGSGDPPLFDRGSLDLVEAMDRAEIIEQDMPATYVTVTEPVTIGGDRGDFVTILPATPGQPKLRLDCAVDFRSVIGKQRIIFDLTPRTFRYGSEARTNTTQSTRVFCKTIGFLFADMRNLGYTPRNILIHGRRRYYSEPRLFHEGKPLEPVWHRAALDLLAALALINMGRFVGTVVSYRAGHTLDCRLVTLLYRHGLLKTFSA